MTVPVLTSHLDGTYLALYYQWDVVLVKDVTSFAPHQDLVLEQVVAWVVLMMIQAVVQCQ